MKEKRYHHIQATITHTVEFLSDIAPSKDTEMVNQQIAADLIYKSKLTSEDKTLCVTKVTAEIQS